MAKKSRSDKSLARRQAKKERVQFSHRMSKLPPPEVVLPWIAQGANYLASDYETGLWDPIFTSVYEGKLLTVSQMAEHIAAKCKADLEHPETWSKGKLLLAWVIADPELLLTYRQGALRKLGGKHPGEDTENLLLAPKQPELWEFFHSVKTMLKERYA